MGKKEKRARRLELLLTEPEAREITQAAELQDLNLSEYMRMCAIRYAHKLQWARNVSVVAAQALLINKQEGRSA
jgi:uncharacterized protein (DUF1778 family)